MIDVTLKDWATPRQAEFVDAINTHGSNRKASRALNINQRTLEKSIATLRASAAKRGYSPDHDMTHPVPAPFVVRGTSTLYDEDGKARLQWVKTRLDDDRLEQTIREAIDALSEGVKRVAPVKGPKDCAQHLANLYTLTDCHVGMKAWGEECGEDWDLAIAEQTLSAAFQHLIESCPVAKIGIVNELGDFLHFDSLDAVTPQHRNLLDSDSRFPKVVSVAVRVLRNIINAALKRHEQVIVVMSEGNHDMASSVWLRCLFGLLYENEPRVKVIDAVTPYFALSLGKTMLAFHHGHLSKNEALPMLFAASYPQMWGETTKRYCHTGHRHHVEEKEHSGMTVIQHPTIAARDAYAARGGWIADRSMTAITYHAQFGQVARVTVCPEMLQ